MRATSKSRGRRLPHNPGFLTVILPGPPGYALYPSAQVPGAAAARTAWLDQAGVLVPLASAVVTNSIMAFSSISTCRTPRARSRSDQRQQPRSSYVRAAAWMRACACASDARCACYLEPPKIDTLRTFFCSRVFKRAFSRAFLVSACESTSCFVFCFSFFVFCFWGCGVSADFSPLSSCRGWHAALF